MTKKPPTACVFCEIVADRAPAVLRARGISSIAIEPLNPVAQGHLLVIPRRHVTDAFDDPRVTAATMYDAAAWAEMFGSHPGETYHNANIITSIGSAATQTVFHLHIHVVPRREGDGLALPWTGQHHHSTVSGDDR